VVKAFNEKGQLILKVGQGQDGKKEKERNSGMT